MLELARRHVSFALGALVLALAACGSSVDTSAHGGATATTTGSGGAGGNDNPCWPDSCTGPTSSSSSGSGSSSGGAGGSSGLCLASSACTSDAFCDFANDDCGGGQPGFCTPKPQACPDNYAPTCGCDGKIYGNECDANAHGVDVSNLGGCAPPAGMFACGATFCALGQSYCQRQVSDVGNIPDSFSCIPLPAACAMSATCACLAQEPCAFACKQAPSGGMTLSCPGG